LPADITSKRTCSQYQSTERGGHMCALVFAGRLL
jgi:hypothetical protein